MKDARSLTLAITPAITLVATLAIAPRVALAQTAAGPPVPIVEYLFNGQSEFLAVNTGSLGGAADGEINGAVRTDDADCVRALAFDGEDDHVRVPDAWDYTDRVTVEAWIKPTRGEGQNVVYDDYGNPGVLLDVRNGRIAFTVSTEQDPEFGIRVRGPIVIGEWQHVAGVYDGTNITVYLNGEPIDTDVTSGMILNNSLPSAIGADNEITDALNFQGNIDSFRIFLDALTPEQLAAEGCDLPTCRGDISGDGHVEFNDILAVLSAWGECEECPEDLNEDGFVDFDDLLLVLAAWGPCE